MVITTAFQVVNMGSIPIVRYADIAYFGRAYPW